MTDRALNLDAPSVDSPRTLHNDEKLELVIDLRDQGVQDELRLGPWLSEDANLVRAPRAMRTVRRLIDILGSLLGLVLLLPLFLVVAIGVKASSPGPVFYKQRRVGQGGIEFNFYKFRSMTNGAANEKIHLVDLDHTSGPIFKVKNDPRITPFGHWIRRTSIDELPQLWNVLRGQMGLVGPRPHLPEEVTHYGDWEKQRLSVKPGITGIWQVSGRSELDFETWVSMDIEYIENWSLWMDLRILLRTIPAVLSGRGAY